LAFVCSAVYQRQIDCNGFRNMQIRIKQGERLGKPDALLESFDTPLNLLGRPHVQPLAANDIASIVELVLKESIPFPHLPTGDDSSEVQTFPSIVRPQRELKEVQVSFPNIVLDPDPHMVSVLGSSRVNRPDAEPTKASQPYRKRNPQRDLINLNSLFTVRLSKSSFSVSGGRTTRPAHTHESNNGGSKLLRVGNI